MRNIKIKILIISLIIIFSSFFSLLFYFIFRPQSIPVLAYHDVIPSKEMTIKDKSDYINISLEKFEQQMKYIYDKKYKTLSMAEFYCWMKKECEQPTKSVLITFDDGCVSIYKHVLPILKKYNLKATSFVITSRLQPETKIGDDYSYLTLEMIEQARNEYKGLEFHTHTHDLHHAINDKAAIYNHDYEELLTDALKAKEILNSDIIAYPFGAYNNEFIKALKDAEYTMGFLYKKPFHRARQDQDLFKISRVTMNGNLDSFRFKLALRYGIISKYNFIPR